jgi:hypothetical protein
MGLSCDNGSWEKEMALGKKQKPGQIICNMNGKIFVTTWPSLKRMAMKSAKKEGRLYEDYGM